MPNLSDLPIDEIRALADERERYEGWIRALDGRRGQTPPHVYDRVRADYDGRLGRVMERLGQHVAPLRDGETRFARRGDELERSLAERQDELAEIELRTVVGEYAADEGERLRAEKDGEVRALEAERGQVDEDLATLRALLARATPPGESADRAPAADLGPESAPTSPAAAGDWPGSSSGDSPGSSPSGSPGTSLGDSLGDPDEPWPEAAVSGTRGPAEPAPAGGGGGETAAGWGGPAAGTPAGGQSAVAPQPPVGGVGAGFPVGADATATAAAAGGTPTRDQGPSSPSYAVAGMPEPDKTLKCPECAAMNYPTEWYCERCGGELAAL